MTAKLPTLPQVPRKSKARTLADMCGGTLDDSLAEEGILEECTAAALKETAPDDTRDDRKGNSR